MIVAPFPQRTTDSLGVGRATRVGQAVKAANIQCVNGSSLSIGSLLTSACTKVALPPPGEGPFPQMPIQPANGMPQRLPGEIKPHCAQALPRKKKRIQPCAQPISSTRAPGDGSAGSLQNSSTSGGVIPVSQGVWPLRYRASQWARSSFSLSVFMGRASRRSRP